MTRRLADYIEAGKRLDPDEREIAALALQHVDEAEQAEVDAAWDQEIDRRVEEIVNGEVELVDSHETFAMIHQMIADRRNA
ncbi:addiction module protein [Georgenia sp. TF02-10]|uniref:addiction module protein n=1 Tax=Georgenia sp. TF02-10 TaxID=2917725 RepID=UPI001FA70B90|nr:addiction module protein [Georgenia sp. TF02-10]UNX54972.1 addiction module protein [Georgenia sp. TF02-10]